MYYIYILKSQAFSRYYTGITTNLKRRLTEHNQGQTKSTKPYKPWQLVYFEQASSRQIARQQEKYLKSGVGREIRKTLLSA